MATNPIGPNKATLTLYLDSNVLLDTSSVADVCGIKPAEYARAVLEDALKKKLMVRKNPGDVQAYRDAILAQQPKPKIRLEVMDLKKTVSLPSSLFDDASARAKNIGFTTFSAYVQHLVEKDLDSQTVYAAESTETPPPDASTTTLRATAEPQRSKRPKR